MEQLHGLDSLFIRHETAHAPLHVLAVMNVSRRRSHNPITAETYRAIIASRIHDFPNLCKKLVEPPFPIAPPLWVTAKPDLKIHVKEVTLGMGSIPKDFNAYLSKLDSTILDRSRPLWEFHIVHEKDSEESHLVAKAHHALLDGIAGFELVANIFDADELSADKDLENPKFKIDIKDEVPDWTTHYGATLLSQPVLWAQSAAKVARNILTFAKTTLESDKEANISTPWNAPAWPESRVLTKKRVLSQASLEKDTIKKLRRAHGVSFHDVLGAVTAGALRNVMLDNNELLDEPLLCVSPVSVRRKRATHGNELTVMFASLPTHIQDPVERIKYMKESFQKAKEIIESIGPETLGEISRLVPWSALGAIWNLYAEANLSEKHAPFANIMLSSMPGPSFPLYCGGAKVQSAFPYGPIFDGSLLNISAISYMDKVNCGIVSCPDSFERVDDLANALSNSLTELEKTI